MQSLCHEYQFSFILKLELISITKISQTLFERETEGNSEMVYSPEKWHSVENRSSFKPLRFITSPTNKITQVC